jgi:hypothetical protein
MVIMKKNRLRGLWFVSFLLVGLGVSDLSKAATPLRFVLTGNPGQYEVGMDIGCTYEALPPHSNPKDPKHTRLVDRDRPSANWHTTTGFNWKDQDVIFDLGTRCRVDAVAMLFDRPQKPAHVDQAEITAAIKDLDSDQFAMREAARQILLRIGEPAVSALESIRESGTLEQKRSAERLLAKIAGSPIPDPLPQAWEIEYGRLSRWYDEHRDNLVWNEEEGVYTAASQ